MKPLVRMPLFFLGILLLALFMEACVPRIQGARPHRRDRHCGCENTNTAPADTVCYLTQK